MIIVPLGLVSKTKNIPIATILLSVITFYYSIIHFPLGDEAERVFYHSQNREAYAREARKHVIKTCDTTQAKTWCEGLDEIPEKHFLVSDQLGSLDEKDKRKHHYNYINEELEDQKLQTSSPQLYHMKLWAKNDLKEFSKANNLLAKENITWMSALKILFLHGGWMHLLGNFLILVLLAFPVEERMGSAFFAGTYILSGMFGSALHSYFMNDAFYLVGGSSAISGVAGAFTLLFWKNHIRIWVSFFFVLSKRVILPVYFYTPFFMVAADLAGTMNTLTNTAHLAHLGGFAGGLALAFLFNSFLPLPREFTFPYEFEYFEKTKKSLSQLDQIKVYTEWLYFAPRNLLAFKGLVKEVSRSDSNPKVKAIINRFRKIHFEELYSVNKNRKNFLKLLPIEWLNFVPLGDDPIHLKKWAREFEEARDFVGHFKMNFLILNDVGWSDPEAGHELFKSYKRATTNKDFKIAALKLRQSFPPFDRLLKEYKDYGETRIA